MFRSNFIKGEIVEYIKNNSEKAKIIGIHFDDDELYYTIIPESTGREKQTDPKYLKKIINCELCKDIPKYLLNELDIKICPNCLVDEIKNNKVNYCILTNNFNKIHTHNCDKCINNIGELYNKLVEKYPNIYYFD